MIRVGRKLRGTVSAAAALGLGLTMLSVPAFAVENTEEPKLTVTVETCDGDVLEDKVPAGECLEISYEPQTTDEPEVSWYVEDSEATGFTPETELWFYDGDWIEFAEHAIGGEDSLGDLVGHKIFIKVEDNGLVGESVPLEVVPGQVLENWDDGANEPVFHGSGIVGLPMTVQIGPKTFAPRVDEVSCQWFQWEDGADDDVLIKEERVPMVAGGVTCSHTPTAADLGSEIWVDVYGHRAGWEDSDDLDIGWAEIRDIDKNRFSGSDRYDTNFALLKEIIEPGMAVFVATGADFPDTLTVGPVAALSEGAIALTRPGKIDQRILDLFVANEINEVFIIGGTGAVSTNVEKQLKDALGTDADVVRIGGKDRYETSLAVAKHFFYDEEDDEYYMGAAVVATGQDFPDALSASGLAEMFDSPVILVRGSTVQTLPEDILKSIGLVAIVGGKGVVNQQFEDNLSALIGEWDEENGVHSAAENGELYGVARLAGENRYGTNLAVNKMINDVNEYTGAINDLENLWIATGRNFPDALSAAAISSRWESRLVLSNGNCIMNPVVSDWVNATESEVESLNLVGGTGVLSNDVFNLKECAGPPPVITSEAPPYWGAS